MNRVFADTNVLFPFSIMDLLLGLDEDGFHRIVWSDDLLAEWERVIVREDQRTADSASSIVATIRDFFADGEIPTALYVANVDDMPSTDVDDRKHMSAAIAGKATVLLTWNLKHFAAEFMLEKSVRVIDPDAYLCEQLSESPDQVLRTVTRTAGEKHRPKMTVNDTLVALERAGLSGFVRDFRERFMTD